MANESIHGGRATEAEAGSAGTEAAAAGLGSARLLFLLAAGLSFLLSVALWFGGDRERGLFVGLWVPSILAAGTLLRPAEGARRE